MDASYIAQQLINGLSLGSMYALIAIGFSMIYGIIRLINFAHGDIMMIGAFTTAALVFSGVPWPLVALGALAVGAVAGMAVETLAFRPMRGSPQVTGFIASLAVAILIQNLGILLLSSQPRTFRFPGAMHRQIEVGALRVSVLDLTIIVGTLIIMLGLTLMVKKTRLGMAMRATAENLQVARLMGIRTNRTVLATFAIGSALAGIAGLMWGGRYGQIDPLMGFEPGLKAFVAAVIGGVGSIFGAMVGGYILGVSEILFVGLLPPEYSAYRDVFVFGLLIVILLVMPNGLFGKSTETRG